VRAKKIPKALVDLIKESGNLRNLRIWSHLNRWKFSKKSKGFCISKTARGMAVGLSQRRRKMWRLRLAEDGQVDKVG